MRLLTSRSFPLRTEECSPGEPEDEVQAVDELQAANEVRSAYGLYSVHEPPCSHWYELPRL